MDIGILGLGVMGKSLALNFEHNGFAVAGYDANPEFDNSTLKGGDITVFNSVRELVVALDRPRRILIMVPAGKSVDDAITSLQPHLQADDIIIDGGNSFFMDTERRIGDLESAGIRFIGMGVSGGEKGALRGPSLMPGGSKSAWEEVRSMLEAIAAKAADGTPCVEWMGRGGAGHYVKMAHNGIEYADMQLIAEIYDLLHRGARVSNGELAEIFSAWNKGRLNSYLIQITSEILQHPDESGDKSLVDLIRDEAAQKGTGKWVGQNSLELGASLPTIHAAVEMRLISGLKLERTRASILFNGNSQIFSGDKEQLIRSTEKALYASKITAYAQGFTLLRAASKECGLGLNYAGIARIWRAGCIIRAALLEDVVIAFEREPELSNLLLNDLFRNELLENQFAWRSVAKAAIDLGIPAMALSASLAYFDAYRSEKLPMNLIQALRDHFGAHTYERVDKAGPFHTEWAKPQSPA